METAPSRHQRYLFVCENERAEGRCCAPEGSRLRELLKAAVKAKGLSRALRVSKAGCLDVCDEGPNVLLLPERVWFKKVAEADVDAIVARAAEGLA